MHSPALPMHSPLFYTPRPFTPHQLRIISENWPELAGTSLHRQRLGKVMHYRFNFVKSAPGVAGSILGEGVAGSWSGQV